MTHPDNPLRNQLLIATRIARARGYRFHTCRLERATPAEDKRMTARPPKGWVEQPQQDDNAVILAIQSGHNSYIVHTPASGCSLLDADDDAGAELMRHKELTGVEPHVRSPSGPARAHTYVAGVWSTALDPKIKFTAFGPGSYVEVISTGERMVYLGELPDRSTLPRPRYIPPGAAPRATTTVAPSMFDALRPPKTMDVAVAQWVRLRERVIGFVRERAHLPSWGDRDHTTLLEMTRELAQLAPASAHQALAEWFAAAGATYVDDRVWKMLDDALAKYPADVLIGSVTAVRDTEDDPDAPKRLPMIPDMVWDTYAWTRSIRAQARAADVCPDAVLGAMLALYASRVPPSVRIVTGTKMPLGCNLVVALAGPPGSDKSTAFDTAVSIAPHSAVPVVDNPNSGEAFAATFVEPDPDQGKGATRLRDHPHALFYIDEGGMVAKVNERAGSTWSAYLRSLAVDRALSTTNATTALKRVVPSMSYRAGVVAGFQAETAVPILRDTATGTAQRFLWFSALSSEDLPTGVGTDAPHVDMAVPNVTALGRGVDGERETYPLTVVQSITDRIKAEQKAFRLGRSIDDQSSDAHRHLLVAKVAALAVLANGGTMIGEQDWAWAESLYAASSAVRDALLDVAEDKEQAARVEAADRMGAADSRRKEYAGHEDRVAQVLMRKVGKLGGSASRRDLQRAVMGKDRHLFVPALDRLVNTGMLRLSPEGRYHTP